MAADEMKEWCNPEVLIFFDLCIRGKNFIFLKILILLLIVQILKTISDMGGDDGLVSLCLDEADGVHEWGPNPLLLQIQRYVKKRVDG